MNKMQTGKSPGNDGLTLGLYQAIWDKIEPYFFKSLTASLEQGELPLSQRQSIIRLIEKQNKDPLKIENYRPISLMNVDAKIIAKVLAARIETTLPSFIHPDQLAFVKGRNITEGIRKACYLIEHCNLHDVDGWYVGVDFAKAFDTVEHDHIWFSLEQAGFGPELISMIKTLYNNSESAVLNEGISSKYFKLGRSCKQGDPIAPILFIIAINNLLYKITQSENVEGIDALGNTYKLTAFADDITILASKTEDITNAVKLIKDFGSLTGLQMNDSKTELFSTRGRPPPQNLGLKFVTNITITGATLSVDPALNYENNYKKALDKMETALNMWRQRNLSLLGRVLVVKSQALSRLQFLASVLPVPDEAVKRATKLIYKFVYKGNDKIKREWASREVRNGGIKLPKIQDVISSAQCQWVRKMCEQPNRNWVAFLKHDLDKIGGTPTLSGSLVGIPNHNLDYKYNKEILAAWAKVATDNFELNPNAFAHASPYFNKLFRLRYAHLKPNRLAQLGFNKIGHFFFSNGELITSNDEQRLASQRSQRMEENNQ